MSTGTFNESDVENTSLTWLEGLGWLGAHYPGIAPDAPGRDCDDYGQVGLNW